MQFGIRLQDRSVLVSSQSETRSTVGLAQRKSTNRRILRGALQGIAICILLSTIGCAFFSAIRKQPSTIEEVVDGRVKRFEFPVRTTAEGEAAPEGGFDTHADLGSPALCTEPESAGGPLAMPRKPKGGSIG